MAGRAGWFDAISGGDDGGLGEGVSEEIEFRTQNSELRRLGGWYTAAAAGVGEYELGGTAMQFLIHGADQKTGKEMTIVVDARDQTEAEQRVLYNDILIASMAQFAAPPVVEERPVDLPVASYLRPEPAPEVREKKTRTPIYKEILRGAKWLGGLAMFVRMVGVFLLLVALCLVVVPLIPWTREIMPLQKWPLAWFVGGAVMMVMAFG